MIEPSDSRNGFLIKLPNEIAFNQAYLDIQPWSDDPYMDILDSGDYEVLYANKYAGLGFTKPMDDELANLFRNANTLNNPNLRQQIAKIMENYDGDNGPWYISGDESNIIIHNYGGPSDDKNGIVFKYQEEFGEVLSVSISEHEVYGGSAMAKIRARGVNGDPLTSQTSVDLLPKPSESLTPEEEEALQERWDSMDIQRPDFSIKRVTLPSDRTRTKGRTKDKERGLYPGQREEQYKLNRGNPESIITRTFKSRGVYLPPQFIPSGEGKINQSKYLQGQEKWVEANKAREAIRDRQINSKVLYTDQARTQALDNLFKSPEAFFGRLSSAQYDEALEAYVRIRSGISIRGDVEIVKKALEGMRVQVQTTSEHREGGWRTLDVITKPSDEEIREDLAPAALGTAGWGINSSFRGDYPLSAQLSQQLGSGKFLTQDQFLQLLNSGLSDRGLVYSEGSSFYQFKRIYAAAKESYENFMYKDDGSMRLSSNRDFRSLHISGSDVSPEVNVHWDYELITHEANVDALELYQQQTNDHMALVVEGLNNKIDSLGSGVAGSFAAGKSAVNSALNKMNRAKTLETEVQLKVVGRPSLCSGLVITLLNIGEKYSGKWYIKTCVHQIDNSGYTSSLTLIKNKKTKALTKIIKTTIRSESGRDVIKGNVTVVNRNANGDLVETTMSRGEYFGQLKDLDLLMNTSGASPEQIAAAKVLHQRGITIGYYDSEGNFIADWEVINAQVESQREETERLLKSQARKVRRTSQAYKAIKDLASVGSQVSPSDPVAFAELVEGASDKVGQLKSWLDNLNTTSIS